MKSFIVLAAIAVLTLGNAVAGMPRAVSTGDAASVQAAQPLLTMIPIESISFPGHSGLSGPRIQLRTIKCEAA